MRCTRDAELYALMHIVMVIIGLRLMLAEMKLLKDGPTEIYVDNTAVLDGLVNKKQSDRSQRYSEIRRGWIRKQVEDLLVNLLHCQTKLLLADSGTKAHTGEQKTRFREILLGLRKMDRDQFSTVARHSCNLSPRAQVYGKMVRDADIDAIQQAMVEFSHNIF